MSGNNRNQIAIIVGGIAGVALLAWLITTMMKPNLNRGDGPDQAGTQGQNGDSPSDSGSAAKFTTEQMRTAIAAVAATEEAKFEQARQLWTELRADFPDDREIQINEAVAVLKWTDVITEALGSQDAKTSPQQRAAMEAELQDAFTYADRLMAELRKVEQDDYRVPLIQAELVRGRSERADYEQSNALKKQAAEILAQALEKDPNQPILASAFDQTLLRLAGTAPELEAMLPDVLYAAFNVDQDNLYLLKSAASSLLAAKDVRLKELVQPTIDLTRPLWSSRQRDIDRIKPEELAEKTLAAIDEGDWRSTLAFRRWLNVLLGMSGFNDDYKRTNPDPLALLDTSFLLRMAPQRSMNAQAQQVEFASTQLDVQATAACWVDIDFDLIADIVVATDSELQFYLAQNGDFTFSHAIALDQPATGLVALDLFEVRIPEAPKLPTSVAELMLDNSFARKAPPKETDNTSTDGPQATPQSGSPVSGARHSVLRELLVYGNGGIQIVSLEDVGPVTEPTGLESLQNVRMIEAADIESDGDLDLLILTDAGPVVMQNNGNRTFADITKYTTFGADVTILDAKRADYDQDLDQDFLLATSGGLAVLENVLHSQFRLRMLSTDDWETGASQCISIADFDRNRSWDIVSGNDRNTTLVSTITAGPGEVNASRQQVLPTAGGLDIAVTDVNCDGFLDILSSGPKGLSLAMGVADLEFQDPFTVTAGKAGRLQVLDHDYDGKQEILCIIDQRPTVFTSSSELAGNYNIVRLAGINDINGGGRINHFGLGSVLEIWTDQGPFTRLVDGPITHIGLGEEQAKSIRVVFTNGLTQNIEDVPENVLVEEIQIQRGSCPYVYGHDGKEFQLITDLLWNAPLGLQVSRGKAMKDRRWEHVLLPGKLVRELGGSIPLQITEELWEVAYFDHVQLTAIDHPKDVRVFTNEKVGPPDIATERIFAVRETIHANVATDTFGRDCTQELANTDRNFVQAFQHQFCQGLCEPHFIELDFGQLDNTAETLRLYLNGWLYPTDTSLNIGISQNPQRNLPEPPSLWIVGENGKWKCVKPFIGFPGGKPKTIVVDISKVFPTDDHRIRIASSQQLYWDEAFVSTDDLTNYQTQILRIESADLHYRGYSKPLHRVKDQPHWFDYTQVETAPIWPTLDGPFTRYGDVRDILDKDDDQMVVIVGGDEISLQFSPPSNPIAEGWTRDFVLHSTGWDKDADINTLEGQGSLPLPFMAQENYPTLPEQSDQARRVFEKNAATLTRYLPNWSSEALSRAGWMAPTHEQPTN